MYNTSTSTDAEMSYYVLSDAGNINKKILLGRYFMR